VNGDGYDDVIVGAYAVNGNTGASYVVFGGSGAYLDGLHGVSGFSLSALDGTNGVRVIGSASGSKSGGSVASAGDVNGDGYGDFIVGALLADGFAGASYVVFGGSGAYLDGLHGVSGFSLSALDGTNGFRLDGTNGFDFSGRSVASAGDVNGDGYGDLVVGAGGYGATNAGASYVVFGGSGFGASLALSALDGRNGFRLDGVQGYDYSGSSVASGGDVNGDGFDDLIVGATGANPNGALSGESYVIFGRDFNGDVDTLGTLGADSLTGSAAAEIFFGLTGDDTIVGGGGADVVRAGHGDDRIVVPDAGFFDINGGGGFDTLALDGTGITLDLTAIADTKITGIEAIDLTGSGSNSLVLKQSEVLHLSEGIDTLFVRGNSGDSVDATDGGWSLEVDQVEINSVYYDVYTKAQVTLLLEDGVSGTGILS
jgi:hypothetical protein